MSSPWTATRPPLARTCSVSTSPTLHRHPQEQITLVQEGDLEFSADGRSQRLSQGDWSVVAGGVEHGIRAGMRGARFLAVLVPRRSLGDPYTLTDPTTTTEP